MPGNLRVLIDDGTGFKEWNETAFATGSTVEQPYALEPARPLRTARVLAAAGYMETSGVRHFVPAFPRPGRYLVRVEYGKAPTLLSSNVVIFNVVAPMGSDAELLDRYLKPEPDLLTPWAALSDDEVHRADPRHLSWQPISGAACSDLLERGLRGAVAEAASHGGSPADDHEVANLLQRRRVEQTT